VAPVSADPRTVVDSYIGALEGETRQVAYAEWGITLDAAGWPLHVGVAIRDGVLRAQAQVIEAGRLEPHDLLRWNRQLPFVRFGHTREGEVWIQGDLPLVAISPAELDRFLGLLVLSATQARQAAPVAD
jgi:Putative bacterial sensory transduction regulator